MTFVNVGANKGFAVAAFMQLFAAGWNTSFMSWKHELKAVRTITSCGVCGACSSPNLVKVPKTATVINAVAVEFLSANVALLEHNFKKFGVRGGVVVHGAAGSDTHAIAFEPADFSFKGMEQGIASASNRGKPVPSVTVDALAANRSLKTIDWLSVDTEGHDALVLQGASSMLREKRIRLIEFEYHHRGHWHHEQSLKETILHLDRHGYRCYWQGKHGAIGSATDWCPAFEFRSMSNVVCALAESPLEAALAKMESDGAGKVM